MDAGSAQAADALDQLVTTYYKDLRNVDDTLPGELAFTGGEEDVARCAGAGQVRRKSTDNNRVEPAGICNIILEYDHGAPVRLIELAPVERALV